MPLQDPEFYHQLMDVLTRFSGDLLDHSTYDGVGTPTLSMGGNQRNVLFRNNGDGTFTELGYSDLQ